MINSAYNIKMVKATKVAKTRRVAKAAKTRRVAKVAKAKKTRRGGVKRGKRRMNGGALSDILPTTSWGSWDSHPGALAWSATTTAPPPLANGGLYTAPQSTGSWASQPFPATQYAWSVEAARASQIPDVFYHQQPADNNGASFSPYVGVAISPEHYSSMIPPAQPLGPPPPSTVVPYNQ